MKKHTDKLKLAIFSIVFVFGSMVMNSDNLGSIWQNHGMPILPVKYICVFLVVFLAGLLVKDNLYKASKIQVTATLIITVLFILDFYITRYSGSVAIYRWFWIAGILMSNGGLFVSATISGRQKEEYPQFCNNMFRSVTPLYLFVFWLSFMRMPNNNLTVNLIPTQGTIQMLVAMVRNIHISIEAPLLFFGNLLIFLPVPFILKAWIKNIKDWQIITVGCLLPFIVEAYQYILKCGDVDIDDIILNLIGYMVGYIVIKGISKRHS
ncbi:MAG: VanZ family protein [Eubacterium sp.]